MAFRHKAKKTRLQFTIPENLDNNEDLREIYLDLICMGSRKTQDLLNKLGIWGPWVKVEGERRGRERSRKKMYSTIKSIKTSKQTKNKLSG